MGILFAIEGVDGSGKETQSRLLFEKLKKDYKTRLIGFPNYSSPSSGLVKMYLNGDFGNNAKDVNAYIASTFYAADRYASFMTEWKEDYNEGAVIIADRYASANMIHQAGKIEDQNERDRFLDWEYDFEYNFYKIPVPDAVFYLDVPLEFREKIIKGRKNKINGTDDQDIHEKDRQHILDSYKSAAHVIDKYSWIRICCVKDGELRSIEDINNEIYFKVLELIRLKTHKVL